MELLIFWLLGCMVVAIVASNRRRSSVGWFLISVVISPLLGLILVLALGRPDGQSVSTAEPRVGHQVEPRPPVRTGAARRLGTLGGDGAFRFEVVGEASYQSAIEAIAGGRSKRGANHRCSALLLREPSNPYDSNAVRVEIAGQTVGYLPRHAAVEFTEAAIAADTDGAECEAVIAGGWERGEDRGDFGVRLNAVRPFAIRSPQSAAAAGPPLVNGGWQHSTLNRVLGSIVVALFAIGVVLVVALALRPRAIVQSESAASGSEMPSPGVAGAPTPAIAPTTMQPALPPPVVHPNLRPTASPTPAL